MKTIKILILSAFLFGCTENNLTDCDCEKVVEKYGVDVLFHPNGLPYTSTRWDRLYTEPTFCQEEYERKSIGDNKYQSVRCN